MATTFVPNVSQSRPDGFPPSNLRKILIGVMTTDGNDGASALDIPAVTFGLKVIESCSAAVKSDNTLVVVCAPAYDGLSLLGKAAATAAAADIPSGAYNIIVRGYGEDYGTGSPTQSTS